MARSGPSTRKIIEFDAETWAALRLLSQDSMLSLQELVDEAIRDLLVKHKRPALLRDALQQSVELVPERKRGGRRR